jgi:hypothetical protein
MDPDSDPDPDILSLTLHTHIKNNFKISYSASKIFKGTFLSVFKDKKSKRSTKQ